jgi:hypothetical protein
MPPTPSVTISSPAGRLIILPVGARTAQMQRFQVFTRQGGAGAAAQAKADFLLDMLPQDAAAQQEALRLYAGRLGGMDGFPPDVLEARLRTDLWDGIFVAGYYVPDPGAVPMMPSPETDTAGLMADPAGTPQTWSVPQRIAAMLRRIPKNMPEAMRAQVAALLSPESIAALAIFFAVLAIAQFVGAGEVVDAILAALAWRLAGLAGFYALGEFVGEIIVAARATTLPAIETAAKNAAGDLVTLGVQFLSAVVLRAVAQSKMASAKAEPDPEPPPPPPPKPPITRPSWRASESDVGVDLGPDIRPQVSYLNGKEVPLYTPGSVRPDFVTPDGAASFEVKNYNITNNSGGLIRSVSQQAIQRQANLPTGMVQNIIIDIRGQVVTDAQKNDIISGIVNGSNHIIDPGDIDFKE